MRVLHVLESLAAGGVETTFLNVLRHLPRAMTHDVLAFSGGALEGEYRSAASQLRIASSNAEIERLLIDGDYDVAHLLFERCAMRLLPTLVLRTTTAIVYGKNYDFSGQWRTTEGFHLSVDDALMAASDAVTFTTPQLAAGYDGNEQLRGTVLGKGANVTPLLEIPPAGSTTPERILAIANPNPRKRLGDVIDALSIVRRINPAAHLRIIGSGDANEMHRLSTRAADLGLAEAFTLAGGSRDIASELSQSRIVVLTSGSEGVPTALLEGMAAGRPVVTTDAGHVRSIVDDGVEGFVVPVGDVDAIAHRLSTLLSNRTLASVMGRRGRERAARHSVERIAGRLAQVLAAHGRVPC